MLQRRGQPRVIIYETADAAHRGLHRDSSVCEDVGGLLRAEVERHRRELRVRTGLEEQDLAP